MRKRKPKELKDSGIEWIGKIPNHWDFQKLKWVISESLKYGANESAEDIDRTQPRYLRITDFDGNGNLREDTFKSLPHSVAKNYLLKEGDVLFARSGATVGKTFQFKNYQGEACHAGYLIKASPKRQIIESDYLYLFTKSRNYENWKNSIFIQATIQNISAEKYANLAISLPPKPEQKAIATFLDRKTKAIDQLIEKKQQLIEKLKEKRQALITQAVTKGLNPDASMKDSGIEWLGEIPENWELIRLRYLGKIDTGNKDTQDSVDEGQYPFFVRSDTIERLDSYSFDTEAVMTSGDGAGVCKIYHHFEGKFALHQRMYAIYDFKRVIGKYIYYSMKANFEKEVLKLSAKSTVESLRMPMLKNFPIVLCSEDEQKRIVKFIEDKSTRIDKTVANIISQIEKLNEYRQSLISAAVTGKIDIRDEVEVDEIQA